jgi:hypothetical protein
VPDLNEHANLPASAVIRYDHVHGLADVHYAQLVTRRITLSAQCHL